MIAPNSTRRPLTWQCPCRARRLPPHPPHRIARQPPSHREAGAMSRPTRSPDAPAASTGELPRSHPSANRPCTRRLPRLRRRDAGTWAASAPSAAAAARVLLVRQLMIHTSPSAEPNRRRHHALHHYAPGVRRARTNRPHADLLAAHAAPAIRDRRRPTGRSCIHDHGKAFPHNASAILRNGASRTTPIASSATAQFNPASMRSRRVAPSTVSRDLTESSRFRSI
jgi:hypothetical protein